MPHMAASDHVSKADVLLDGRWQQEAENCVSDLNDWWYDSDSCASLRNGEYHSNVDVHTRDTSLLLALA